ncbi:MAG TPA: flagellar motor protein MotB [Bacteroidota bacterium]|nr:flagellar motor protein MotB [Bacteroidota bacterium]
MVMEEKPEESPIRVVRKSGGHGGHHGGAWKVAYADFVAAMMALFIVLWIVGQSKQVKSYVANYFKDPGAFFENTKGGVNSVGGNIGPAELNVEEFLKRQQERLKGVGDSLMKSIAAKPGLAKLSGQIRIEVVKEGLRIEMLETASSVFFDVGTANMHDDMKKLLGVIAAGIRDLPNHLILEGHTDSRRYASPLGYTNFELSSDRANSARRVLVAEGIAEQRIDEVRGYADTMLRNAADPLDASNRRISIILKFVGKGSHE